MGVTGKNPTKWVTDVIGQNSTARGVLGSWWELKVESPVDVVLSHKNRTHVYNKHWKQRLSQ